jgi:hypothetical protein
MCLRADIYIGGVTNGNDLMAAYARQSKFWHDKAFVEVMLRLIDVGDRGQFYAESKEDMTAGIGKWLGSL